MFECPSVVMAATLQRILDIFPEHTLVWPGHEYSLNFINFTLSDVDPENVILKQRLEDVKKLLGQRHPAVPAELRVEKLCNPYLRTGKLSSEKKEYLKKSSSEVLRILADKKAKFSKDQTQKQSESQDSFMNDTNS